MVRISNSSLMGGILFCFLTLAPLHGLSPLDSGGWPLSRGGLLTGDCEGADAEPLLSTADSPAMWVSSPPFFLLSGIFVSPSASCICELPSWGRGIPADQHPVLLDLDRIGQDGAEG